MISFIKSATLTFLVSEIMIPVLYREVAATKLYFESLTILYVEVNE